MKRVLHIIGKMDRAGAETMLMNLYRTIDRTQVQFDFMVFTYQKGDYDDEIQKLGGKIIPLIASNNWKRMKKMTSFLKEHSEYEVVHCHMLLNSMFPLLAAKQAKVKMRIVHSHSTSNRKKNFIAKIYERFAKQIINKTSTHRIACGEAASAYLFPNNKSVWVLLNGIDLRDLIQIKENVGNEKLSEAKINIIQVGRLTEVKNPFFSLELAHKLKNEGIDFKLHFVGQGNLEESIKSRIKELNLDNVVEVLGVRSDVPELMGKSDLLIMPSIYEGFPVVLAESQAIGLKALVSTQVSTEVDKSLELVDFLSINSTESWIDIIKNYSQCKTMTNHDRFKKLSEAGLNVEVNAKKLMNYYHINL